MAEARRSALTPDYTYSPASRQYRSVRTGRYVPQADVQTALDRVLAASSARLRAHTERLAAGELSVAQWQSVVAQEIKTAHLAGAAVGRGGWAQVAPADTLWTASRLKEQYRYLSRFAEQIASGRQPLNGVALARAELYGHAARVTQREMVRRVARQAGHQWERNVLGLADHCPGCLAATRRGWVAIGTLPPVGARDCRVRCHCSITTVTDRPEALAA